MNVQSLSFLEGNIEDCTEVLMGYFSPLFVSFVFFMAKDKINHENTK